MRVEKLGVPTCLKVLLTWFNAKTALKPQIPLEMKKTTKNPQAQGLRKRKECGGYSKVSSQVNFLVVGFMKTILTLEEYTEANLKAIFSLDLT